ncbi:hypothetical protein [Runella aurantiaca]|uniref:Lipoprotein n=1 Tax=Runella aurantiaca TaxID=2282308 RepID=A0A369IA57_9BACT|nr:hypothetical protein [Runella aurantiaca]RDB06641.1 hypothetical protein DVG78_07840 [Runella aurantiaca]
MKKSYWLLIGLALLAGCTSSGPSPKESDYRFFPLETGRFVEYEVQETFYALSKPPVKITYFLKEVCGPELKGTTGQYQINRFRRNTVDQSWSPDSVWTAYLLPDRAVKVENNRPLLKMIFPLFDGLTWNANQYNTLPPQTSEAHFSHLPFSVNSLTFPANLEIVQQKDSSLVSLVNFTERYAPNVGLIYKESTTLQYCQNADCLGKGIVEFGNRKTLKIKAYGQE